MDEPLESKCKRLLRRLEAGLINQCDLDREFVEAVQQGKTEAVSLLIEFKLVNPTFDHNWAILYAAQHGDNNMLKLLMHHPDVNSTDNFNSALKLSAKNGHHKILKTLLLAYPQIDPVCHNQITPQSPVSNSQVEILKILFAHSRIDYECKFGVAYTMIHWSALNKHHKTAETLLANLLSFMEINNGSPINKDSLFRLALYYKHYETLKILISYPNLDPSFKDNLILNWAIYEDLSEIVELLLAHPKIIFTASSRLIREKIQKNQNEVARLLIFHSHHSKYTRKIKDNQMQESYKKQKHLIWRAFMYALEFNNYEIIDFILGEKQQPVNSACWIMFEQLMKVQHKKLLDTPIRSRFQAFSNCHQSSAFKRFGLFCYKNKHLPPDILNLIGQKAFLLALEERRPLTKEEIQKILFEQINALIKYMRKKSELKSVELNDEGTKLTLNFDSDKTEDIFSNMVAPVTEGKIKFGESFFSQSMYLEGKEVIDKFINDLCFRLPEDEYINFRPKLR